MIAACALGVTTTWLGILLAYDSFYWVPSSQGSRSVSSSSSSVFVACLTWRRGRRRRRARSGAAGRRAGPEERS